MTPRISRGADLRPAFWAMPPKKKADEPRSLSTIAAARQNEINDSMTVVATTTFTRPDDFMIFITINAPPAFVASGYSRDPSGLIRRLSTHHTGLAESRQ